MKIIKENWLIVIIIILFIIFYFVSAKMDIDNQNTIKKIEAEKVELKNKVVKLETESVILRDEADTISGNLNDDITNKDKTIKKLSEQPKNKTITKIVYKDKVIYKTSPVAEVFDMTSMIKTDFGKYVDLTLKDRIKTDSAKDALKKVNDKSEQQMQIIKNIANSWNLNYGAFAGFGTGGFTAGVGITYSKRLRKIK